MTREQVELMIYRKVVEIEKIAKEYGAKDTLLINLNLNTSEQFVCTILENGGRDMEDAELKMIDYHHKKSALSGTE